MRAGAGQKPVQRNRQCNGGIATYAAEIGRDITKVYFNPESADELLQGYASSLGTAEAGD